MTFCLLTYYNPAQAFRTETIPDTEVKNDFVLGGGKTEMELAPGEDASGEISITNRLGKETDFNVEVQDFAGSRDASETSFNFLGEEKSPYSLKDSIFPETKEFRLKHGERMWLPVKISIPKDAEPGGRYGTILIYLKNPDQQMSVEPEKARPQIKIISRLASLFYIKIKGEVKQDGFLKDFSTDRSFYEKGPVNFSMVFENNGNIHLKPSGKIEITNILGKSVGEVPIDEFFVLPDSVRKKNSSWDRNMLIGYYTAKLSLARNYSDLSDAKTIYFWVVPWKLILLIFAACVVVVYLFHWIFSKFEIKRK